MLTSLPSSDNLLHSPNQPTKRGNAWLRMARMTLSRRRSPMGKTGLSDWFICCIGWADIRPGL